MHRSRRRDATHGLERTGVLFGQQHREIRAVHDAVGRAVGGQTLADAASVGDVAELALQGAAGRILLEASVLTAAAGAAAAHEAQVAEFGGAAVRADEPRPRGAGRRARR